MWRHRKESEALLILVSAVSN